MENDIGLLKIDTSHLKLKDKLMPICLPNINVAMTDQCWITGFGNDNKSKIDKIKSKNELDNFNLIH